VTLETAVEFVVKQAVSRHDTAIIDAYRHIFHGDKKQPDTRTALRFGMLVGCLVNKQADHAPKTLHTTAIQAQGLQEPKC
jgi:hypothetical protein